MNRQISRASNRWTRHRSAVRARSQVTAHLGGAERIAVEPAQRNGSYADHNPVCWYWWMSAHTHNITCKTASSDLYIVT